MTSLFRLTAVPAHLPEALPPSAAAAFPLWDDDFGYIWWLDTVGNAVFVARTCAGDGESFDRAGVIPLTSGPATVESGAAPDFLVHTALNYNVDREDEASPQYVRTLTGDAVDDLSNDEEADGDEASGDGPRLCVRRSGAPQVLFHRAALRSSRHLLLVGMSRRESHTGAGGKDADGLSGSPLRRTKLYTIAMQQGIPWISDLSGYEARRRAGKTPPIGTSGDPRTTRHFLTSALGVSRGRLAAVAMKRLHVPVHSSTSAITANHTTTGGREVRTRALPELCETRRNWLYSYKDAFSFSSEGLFVELLGRCATPSTFTFSPNGDWLYVVLKSAPGAIEAVPVVKQGSRVVALAYERRKPFWAIPDDLRQRTNVTSVPLVVTCICADRAGSVWAALGSLGRIVRLGPGPTMTPAKQAGGGAGATATAQPSIHITGSVYLPYTSVVTGCCFGGWDLSTLYITAIPPPAAETSKSSSEQTGETAACHHSPKALPPGRVQLFTATLRHITAGQPTPRISPAMGTVVAPSAGSKL